MKGIGTVKGWGIWALAVGAVTAAGAGAQQMPGTAGESLTGKPVVLAQAVRGHAAVLVFGFTRDASDGCAAWAKALREDSAMAGVEVFQAAMLEQAPGFMRGMIKSGMRKGVAEAEQSYFVVLTQDEKLWKSYLGVTQDKDPYVELVSPGGQVVWHGHGAARDLEPLLRAAVKGMRE